MKLLALRMYRRRATIEPPKWLGRMLQASPGKALTMGFLLIFVMPTDIASMVTVAANLQQNDNSLTDALPFWGLTLLIAALPIISYVLFGKRARTAMPKVRDWMYANSWLVNIIVLGIARSPASTSWMIVPEDPRLAGSPRSIVPASKY